MTRYRWAKQSAGLSRAILTPALEFRAGPGSGHSLTQDCLSSRHPPNFRPLVLLANWRLVSGIPTTPLVQLFARMTQDSGKHYGFTIKDANQDQPREGTHSGERASNVLRALRCQPSGTSTWVSKQEAHMDFPCLEFSLGIYHRGTIELLVT